MIRSTDLLSYIPDFLKDYKEMREIQKTVEPEIQRMENETEVLLNNQYILDTDERGIKLFENMLGIQPLDQEPLKNRQFRVLSEWNRYIPYTRRTLKQKLETLCGKEGYTAEYIPDSKTLIVRVSLQSRKSYEAVRVLLEEMVPQNVVIHLSLFYIQHKTLRRMPHFRLAEYTHQQIRNEVLEFLPNMSVSRMTHGQLSRYSQNVIRRGGI